MLDTTAELLGPTGPVAQALQGFSVRAQQQQMAQVIANAITEQHDLIVEAGTGTGKTFAYLVPAICSGRKVLISTGTKNLQDQLYHRDIPLLRKALKIPIKVALLKGRGNYVCLDRLRKAMDIAPQQEPHLVPRLQELVQFSKQTRRGDIAECDALAEGDPLWFRITSTADNCLGSECSDFQDCFVMHARREAQEADMVVINHHLLLSDMALSEEGFGQILPTADVCVVDEAHQLGDIATQFFGLGVSTQQFVDLAQDTQRAYTLEINETRDVELLCRQLSKAARDLRLVFGDNLRRGPWHEIQHNQNIRHCIERLQQCNNDLGEQLKVLAERSKPLENANQRCISLATRLDDAIREVNPEQIQWYEIHRRSLSLHVTPLDIAPAFTENKLRKGGNWIFTSATLTVAGGFDHFCQRLGLLGVTAHRFDSPFDYARQALLYLPKGMPDPNSVNYVDVVIQLAKKVLQASAGRAFLLFTSHRALRIAEQSLRGKIEYPLLVQGEAPRDLLLERFRQTPNAVLLGTSSFWEGVDVRGEALSCVIIDKLPFATPGDPVLQARLENIRRQGLNPFMNYQLPSAVITLKQGVGRLIRDGQDRGVVVLCDPRLRSKQYGRTFLKSLPPMPITDSLDDIIDFFQASRRTLEAEV